MSTLDPLHAAPEEIFWPAVPQRFDPGGLVLISDRLILRPLTGAALRALLVGDRAGLEESTGALFPDPLVPPPLSTGTLARMQARLLARPEELGWWAWLAVDRTTGTAVGAPSLGGPPDADGTVEVGYATYPEYTGRGYAVEGGRLLLEWVFRDDRVQRVLAVVPPDHAASVSVARRLGLAVIGHAVDDEVGDLLLFERTRSAERPGPTRWI